MDSCSGPRWGVSPLSAVGAVGGRRRRAEPGARAEFRTEGTAGCGAAQDSARRSRAPTARSPRAIGSSPLHGLASRPAHSRPDLPRGPLRGVPPLWGIALLPTSHALGRGQRAGLGLTGQEFQAEPQAQAQRSAPLHLQPQRRVRRERPPLGSGSAAGRGAGPAGLGCGWAGPGGAWSETRVGAATAARPPGSWGATPRGPVVGGDPGGVAPMTRPPRGGATRKQVLYWLNGACWGRGYIPKGRGLEGLGYFDGSRWVGRAHGPGSDP